MMNTNESNKAVGKLTASGTSVPGFSTENVRVFRDRDAGFYYFSGQQDNGEILYFRMTDDVIGGHKYKIGPEEKARAYYANFDDTRYDAESGVIEFIVFDAVSEKAEIKVYAVMVSNSGVEKEVNAKGDFFKFDGQGK
ncbi:hypothetical protein D9M71_614830 [compost metagenome]